MKSRILSGPAAIKNLSYSAEHKFSLLINIKMPIVLCIVTFMSLKICILC